MLVLIKKINILLFLFVTIISCENPENANINIQNNIVCNPPLILDNFICKTLCDNITCRNNEICDYKTGFCKELNIVHLFENNDVYCSDKIDNDNDNLTDCFDIDCFEMTVCENKPINVKITTENNEITGELIAVYNANLWWESKSQLLYAVFNSEKFAQYPNDKSIEFVYDDEILSIEELNYSIILSYDEFVKENNIFTDGSPFKETSYIITGNNSYHFEENGFGNFAYDFTMTDSKGKIYNNDGLNNEDYLVFGKDVYSPVSGYIVELVRDVEDNNPNDELDKTKSNNLIGIQLTGQYYLYLLHFKQHSINNNLQVGDYVYRGDYLGKVGNSGVSIFPHLHLTISYFDLNRVYSVPSKFSGVYKSNAPDFGFKYYNYITPASGEWIK